MSFDLMDRFAQPEVREKVVISRHWNNPEITVTVNRDKITVVADMQAFVDGLIAELKIPHVEAPKISRMAKLLLGELAVYNPQKDRLEQAIRSAATAAIERIKDATSQVM